MKRGLIPILIITALIFQLAFVNATCDLDVSLINQDPYPAIPGDYVKVVFQIEGIENPECDKVFFEINEEYPVSLDINATNRQEIDSGIYQRGYSSFFLIPYKLRIDENALDGNNPIEVNYGTLTRADLLKEFNLYIEDSRADFEIYIKDYSYSTKVLTFEILNIEDSDIEALTIEIPKQENIEIKGPNKLVAGDLDSNEYTTIDFEAIPQDGEINLTIIYTDSINVRRSITKQVAFDSSYFEGRNGDKKKVPWFWIIVVVGAVGWFGWRRYKKNKTKKKLGHHRH